MQSLNVQCGKEDYVVSTTTNSKSFDALGSISDVEDARGVGHLSTISEKEVNNLEEHGPTLVINVEEYDNETAEYMSSLSKRHGGGINDPSVRELDEYDLYDGYDDVGEELEESDDEIKELDDDTARYMSFTDQASGGENDAGLFKNEYFDFYDGYEDQVDDLPEAQHAFCDQFDIRLRSQLTK
ncbi:hypothetical protein Tco_0026421 [Tanacetum coccineum]